MARRSNRRATVTAAVGFGVAELRPDPAHPRAWTLLVDGVPQSYVDLADPAHLRFDYLERLAAVLRSCAPPRVPLEVLHLGGGGLALPRFLDHLRPGSAQRVVERDGALVDLVARLLPPPAAVEVVVGDARAQVEQAAPQGRRVPAGRCRGPARAPGGQRGARRRGRAGRPAGPAVGGARGRIGGIHRRRQGAPR